MRFSSWAVLLGAAARAVAGFDDEDEEVPREPTYFNGKKVPPMLGLTPDNWEKEYKASKYLLVKHYR
jgi:protein disulfide-isomerase